MSKDIFNFNLFSDQGTGKQAGELVNNNMTSRSLKIKSKIQTLERLKREQVNKILDSLPAPGESIHVVSNGSFDYFTIVTELVKLMDTTGINFYFSTWTMSHSHVMTILEMYDAGTFANVNALTGEYFRSREAAVYHILDNGLASRGQKLFCNKNHSKVTLLEKDPFFKNPVIKFCRLLRWVYFFICYTCFALQVSVISIVVEGSANYTANPRIENWVLSNSPELVNFHKDWFNELLNNKYP